MIAPVDQFSEQIRSWNELAQLIEHFSYYSGYDWLFRGVTDASHALVPRIGREKARKLKQVDGQGRRTRVPYRLADERAIYSMFRQQARPHMVNVPQSEFEWLAIAQHFGLATRLLDWTDSLLVAAWFAVEKGGAKSKDSAIWVARGVQSISQDDNNDPLEIQRVAVYRAPHISPRIAAQGSVLMICPDPIRKATPPFCRRITIACEVEFLIKKRLNACGINKRHLFPDLAGLTEYLSWMYKNDWLSGYRTECIAESAAPDDSSDEAVD